MTAEIVERVRRSARYRTVDAGLVARLAAEELPRSRNADDAVKRVKRRLHQAVGAFGAAPRRGRLDAVRAAWSGDLAEPAFRAACADLLRLHAATRERVPHLERLYEGVWSVTGVPGRLLDLGCGLNPLALPWMGLAREATYLGSDVDERQVSTGATFLELVAQPHRLSVRDLVAGPSSEPADVALLLKLVTTLDRQDPEAAGRVLEALRAPHAVISFPLRSLSGRGVGMERTYRRRLDRLVEASARVRAVSEVSVPGELVFVLALDG